MYRLNNNGLIFSASDLVAFLGCRHATYLDRRRVDGLVAPPAETSDPYLDLLKEKGLEHERALRDRFQSEGKRIVEVASDGSLEERTAHTRAAMEDGADVIYQGAFLSGRWHGYADFLLRVNGASRLGSFHYEPLDTKLAHSAKPKHLMQLGIYARLLGDVQRRAPDRVHIALGNGNTLAFPLREFDSYLEGAVERFQQFIEAIPAESVGKPCKACEQCRWREHCEADWIAADHLSLVANISGTQIEKLNAAGVSTVAQLASLPEGRRIERLQPDTLTRLRDQAALQVAKRRDSENHLQLLPLIEGKGFARLPQPSAGDLFFDMEGDPLLEGGLEYLFGFAGEGDQSAFRAFWGHDRAAEKAAFEAAIDFITARLREHPEAHVYHYANYEKSALLKLAMRHGTREAEVDDLVRRGKLVDLFQVVREAVRVSEPSYSIKNLELFYMPPREGEVTTAGASVVVYERWRKLKDQGLLDEIERYNEVDCVSTLKLQGWLLGLRPAELAWYTRAAGDAQEAERTANREAADARIAAMAAELLAGAPGEPAGFRELASQLLEFHRREAKPAWWRQFQCVDLTEEELIDDAECIGGLRRDPSTPPFREKKSLVHTFVFPPQDFKMRKGGRPRRAGTREPAGEIFSVDEDSRRLQLKVGPSVPALGDALSLIPEAPFDDKVLREAVYRYAESVVAGQERYAAITSVLKADLPRIRGRERGAPILPAGGDAVVGATEAIADLEQSHLLVQGPPGTGKTHLSAAAIVELLQRGRRIGVASHTHKAVNRLLEEVVKHAQERRISFRGAKKCTYDEHRCNLPMMDDVFDNDDVAGQHRLVAGTAWLFADPDLDQSLDVLFVDEAGLVSLGNLVAMGLAARNLVLVGDQMQLAQPIQGVHPGRSGMSALEHLLEGHATVPPERGVFLELTRRMHPDVCRFISEAVYETRLQSYPGTERQRLVLSAGADPALKASGLTFVPVSHLDCRQKSEEEGHRVRELFASLLNQGWVDPQKGERPLGVNDILVVSPYNIQVNHLQSILPAGARVGTVDKFQGQEAPVVIVSMTTSSAEDIPRGMEFLYSRNRLNVAISRAKSLAIVVASPLLLEAPCSRVEQLNLVNTLCFAKTYADGAGRQVS